MQATSVLFESGKIGKILVQNAPELLAKLTPVEQDFRTVGHVYMKAGRGSKSAKVL